MQTANDIYHSIEIKLGCKPEDYIPPVFAGTECDNRDDPLEKLNVGELRFLLDHHFFDKNLSSEDYR